MATLRSGILALIVCAIVASLLSFAYADDVIYPGGMIITKFNSSEIGSMHPPEKFNSSEIASMHPPEKFNSSEIASMHTPEKFNSSEIASMQKPNSTVPLPPGVSI
ncbi:MAG: hypothetical protein BWY45_02421 [Euryarchaeota archaeon ADurb.Bin294]|nr:MAG: hypothetical protein BWY45_02421 [Euryarchaeota archaeon ADurb.Bin294]